MRKCQLIKKFNLFIKILHTLVSSSTSKMFPLIVTSFLRHLSVDVNSLSKIISTKASALSTEYNFKMGVSSSNLKKDFNDGSENNSNKHGNFW